MNPFAVLHWGPQLASLDIPIVSTIRSQVSLPYPPISCDRYLWACPERTLDWNWNRTSLRRESSQRRSSSSPSQTPRESRESYKPEVDHACQSIHSVSVFLECLRWTRPVRAGTTSAATCLPKLLYRSQNQERIKGVPYALLGSAKQALETSTQHSILGWQHERCDHRCLRRSKETSLLCGCGPSLYHASYLRQIFSIKAMELHQRTAERNLSPLPSMISQSPLRIFKAKGVRTYQIHHLSRICLPTWKITEICT